MKDEHVTHICIIVGCVIATMLLNSKLQKQRDRNKAYEDQMINDSVSQLFRNSFAQNDVFKK
jgi:hypothetical protein